MKREACLENVSGAWWMQICCWGQGENAWPCLDWCHLEKAHGRNKLPSAIGVITDQIGIKNMQDGIPAALTWVQANSHNFSLLQQPHALHPLLLWVGFPWRLRRGDCSRRANGTHSMHTNSAKFYIQQIPSLHMPFNSMYFPTIGGACSEVWPLPHLQPHCICRVFFELDRFTESSMGSVLQMVKRWNSARLNASTTCIIVDTSDLWSNWDRTITIVHFFY